MYSVKIEQKVRTLKQITIKIKVKNKINHYSREQLSINIQKVIIQMFSEL
jgi:hypothetical protein